MLIQWVKCVAVPATARWKKLKNFSLLVISETDSGKLWGCAIAVVLAIR